MFVEEYIGKKGDPLTFEEVVACQFEKVRLYVFMGKDDIMSYDYCYQMDPRLAKLKKYNHHKVSFYLRLGEETYKLLCYSFWTSKGECIDREVPYNHKVIVVQDSFLNYGVLDLTTDKLLLSFVNAKRIEVVNEDIFVVRGIESSGIIINRDGVILDRLPCGQYTVFENGVLRKEYSCNGDKTNFIYYDDLVQMNETSKYAGVSVGTKSIDVLEKSNAGKTL